jgi:hypothetical protein
MEHRPEKIELHHHAIEEIMGAPPMKSIATGSGIVLILLLVLFAASMFVYSPVTVRANAVIYGQRPLAVLTARQSGQVIFPDEVPGERIAGQGKSIFCIKPNTGEEIIPFVAPLSGIFEVNPLVRIQKIVSQNDTVGFIWGEKPAPVICILQLPNTEAQNVPLGQKIRIFTDTNESKNFIELEISEKSNLLTTSHTQFIAILNDRQLQENDFRGKTDVFAEIIIGKKSLFQQLINPFRGLKK